MRGLTPDEERRLEAELGKALQDAPTIGLVGVSGVGKSSTINAMFKTSLPVSHTVACTKEFWALNLDLRMTQGPASGQVTKLVVHDAPGLGEDVAKDDEYLAMYREKLPSCDIILWVLAARNRAVALDQRYLAQLGGLTERIVFGLNQVDLVEPMNWKAGLPIPSVEQERHIAEIVADRGRRLASVVGREVEVIPYSTVRGYNLEALFTGMLRSCTGNRSWIFSGLKNFSYKDAIPVGLRRGETAVPLDGAADGEGRATNETGRRGANRFFSALDKLTGRQSERAPRAEEVEAMEARLIEEKGRQLSKAVADSTQTKRG